MDLVSSLLCTRLLRVTAAAAAWVLHGAAQPGVAIASVLPHASLNEDGAYTVR
jgi:hypothetical protein